MIINIDLGNGVTPEHATAVAKTLITGMTPVAIYLAKEVLPRVPKWALPLAAPVIGIAFGAAMQKLGIQDMTLANTAQAGGLGVFVREAYDQLYGKKAEAAKEALEYKAKAEAQKQQ